MSYKVWIETEELDNDGDQIQEIEPLCATVGEFDTMEYAEYAFNCACSGVKAVQLACSLADVLENPGNWTPSEVDRLVEMARELESSSPLSD